MTLQGKYINPLTDFVFDEHKYRTEILHTVKLKDQKNRLFYDKLTYIYIELPKFTKIDRELETKFDK